MYKYLSIILVISFFSCHKPYDNKEGDAANAQKNEAKTPSVGEEVITSSGLKFVDEVIGTGTTPKAGDKVKVHYTGTLEDGTKFDSSHDRDKPFSFPLGQGRVIKGWDEAIALMSKGEKRTLIIPPELGYGSRSKGKIPSNSTLIFEVELIDFQ